MSWEKRHTSQTEANKRKQDNDKRARRYIFGEPFVMIAIVEAYADPSLFKYNW